MSTRPSDAKKELSKLPSISRKKLYQLSLQDSDESTTEELRPSTFKKKKKLVYADSSEEEKIPKKKSPKSDNDGYDPDKELAVHYHCSKCLKHRQKSKRVTTCIVCHHIQAAHEKFGSHRCPMYEGESFLCEDLDSCPTNFERGHEEQARVRKQLFNQASQFSPDDSKIKKKSFQDRLTSLRQTNQPKRETVERNWKRSFGDFSTSTNEVIDLVTHDKPVDLVDMKEAQLMEEMLKLEQQVESLKKKRRIISFLLGQDTGFDTKEVLSTTEPKPGPSTPDIASAEESYF